MAAPDAEELSARGAATPEIVRRAPKVLLHDHLDGGLRPATVVELAREVGHELPTTDPDELGRWFLDMCDSGSLEQYLETFEHTVAVKQRASDLRRIARECVEDLAADGVVYAQARSREIAELVVANRDRGVAGFDIAGAEAGYPPTRHLDAFEYLQRENCHFTIHAGEAFGTPSIWQALQWCGADRLGHGERIIDDIRLVGGGAAA